MEVNQGQLLKLISVIKKSVEVNHSMKLIHTPFSYCIFLSFSAEKLRLQEELFRLRSYRKDGEARKEHLLNRAKLLQARAASHKQKVIFFCFLHSPSK